MGRTTYMRVSISNEQGETRVYDAGDVIPDDWAERVTNDAIWEEPDVDQPRADSPFGVDSDTATAPYRSSGVADAPYANSASALRPSQPDSGPVVETGSTELTGEDPPLEPMGDGGSNDESGTGSSLEDLDRMTRAQLEEVALRRGIADPSAYPTKAELRSAIDSADEPGS